ncbi:hypothetical protein C1646_760740 [Rhizophagus diaphanus]|nr:hypothetical protein C1646_760740 [Rhizophagus diaphanus] [Rhizophagus sp. MUCL 43196]
MAYMYPNKCHSVLVALLHSSNQLYVYDSNFQKDLIFTLCSKCNSQLLEIKILIIKQSDKISEVDNTLNSDSSFRFKPVINTPDLTKPAKAITLEKKPVDYYEFEELILQRVCEAVEAVEEEEDFEEFIKEYYRLTSSNKVLLITVIIQKKRNGEKKNGIYIS